MKNTRLYILCFLMSATNVNLLLGAENKLSTDMRVLEAMEKRADKVDNPKKELSDKQKMRDLIRKDIEKEQLKLARSQSIEVLPTPRKIIKKKVSKPEVAKQMPFVNPYATQMPGGGLNYGMPTQPNMFPSATMPGAGQTNGAINPYNQYYYQVMENVKRAQAEQKNEKWPKK